VDQKAVIEQLKKAAEAELISWRTNE
jgi:hypothetical protein